MFLNLNAKLADRFGHWLYQRPLVCVHKIVIKLFKGNLAKKGKIEKYVDLARLSAKL